MCANQVRTRGAGAGGCEPGAVPDRTAPGEQRRPVPVTIRSRSDRLRESGEGL